ncbi:MAG TPA: tetratricopeptide repeat protein, partial [Bacteroidia bacterium]
MKNKIYFLLLLCFAFSTKGISGYSIDSLKSAFESASDPAEKFNTCFRLVRVMSSRRNPDVTTYCQKCVELSAQLNTPLFSARAEFLKAILQSNGGKSAEANRDLETIVPRLLENSLKEDAADAYSFMGMNSLALGDFRSSIEHYQKSNVLSKEVNKQDQLCDNNLYIGRCYENLGNNTKALEYYQVALGMAKSLNNRKLIVEVTIFIGALYSDGINNNLGLEYLGKAAALAEDMQDTSMLISVYTYIANNHYYNKQYISALKMYQKVKDYCSTHGSKNTYAGVLGNMGNVYADMGEMERAMDLQLEAVKIFDEISDKQGLTICYSALGIDYLNTKQYDKALEYFNKSLPMAIEMQSLDDLIEIHFNLSRLYEEKKDYEKAFDHYRLYKQFSDSVYNSNNAQKITEMELNYQFESQQKEAKLKEELVQERYKRFMLIAIAGTIILLIVVFLVA